MKKIWTLLGILGLSIGLAACGSNNEETSNQKQDKSETEQKANQETQQSTDTTTNGIAANDFYEPFKGNIEHVHGLGYSGNQNAVFFASHDGLKVFENGQWYKTISENHDYMGFNAVEEGFYTSGHPEAGSDLANPFGIKKSVDNGRTLKTLTLEGETDFHTMGVGYESKAIFVMNPQKNSLMAGGEFYMSEDEAKTWKKTAAKGLEGDILSVAVHPTNPDILAVAGSKGIYLSKDKGETFQLISKDLQGTMVFMTEDTLWYGGFNGQAKLIKHSLDKETEEEVILPKMKEDAVMYLAQNPQNENEVTFISFKGNAFITNNGTETWEVLLTEGNPQ